LEKNGSKVSAQSPFTNAANVLKPSLEASPGTGPESGIIRKRAQRVTPVYPVKGRLQPRSLALLGLAVAIALWGFGYRLSQYQLHPASNAQAAAAKLCIEPRNPSLTAVSVLKASLHVLAVAPAVYPSVQPFHLNDSAPLGSLLESSYRSATFDFLIPFRSPPPQRFLLA
jgi:hypothetical protein